MYNGLAIITSFFARLNQLFYFVCTTHVYRRRRSCTRRIEAWRYTHSAKNDQDQARVSVWVSQDEQVRQLPIQHLRSNLLLSFHAAVKDIRNGYGTSSGPCHHKTRRCSPRRHVWKKHRRMAEIVVLLLQHTSQGYDAVASNGPPTDVGCHAAVTVWNVGEHEHHHSPTNQAASHHQLVSTPTLWK